MPETQSDFANAMNTITAKVSAAKVGRGRPRGTRNKPDHKARPKKPPEVFAPSIWESGRAHISVEQRHIDEAMRANSSHCAIALAIAEQVPTAKFISVDVQTVRFTCSKRGVRYVFLTPHVAQSLVIGFDQGDDEACKPVSFSMKPAFVTKSGAKRRHTPDPEQLRGTGLKVADEQPHIPAPTASNDTVAPASGAEKAMAESWKPKAGAAPAAR